MTAPRMRAARRATLTVLVLAAMALPWAAASSMAPAVATAATPGHGREPWFDKPTTTTTTPTTTTTTTTTTTSPEPTTTTTSPATTSTTPTTTTTTAATTTTTTNTTVAAGNGVTEKKTFTVTVVGTTAAAPAVWAGDVDATLAVTVVNTSPSQSLGSVNVTVPAPFALLGAPADAVAGGPVVELRNLGLPPGGSTVVALTVAVEQCSSGTSAPLAASAKQSNDYNGAGNDFTLAQPSDLDVDIVGTCSLGWAATAADAERAATITSEAWNPAGAPIAVEVLDGGGADRATRAAGRVGLEAFNAGVAAPVAGGTTTAVIDGGLATFSPGPTLAPSAFDYSFAATSAGLVGIEPGGVYFDVVDQAVNCPAGSACNGAASTSTGRYTASAQFGSGASSTHLTVSINAADIPSFECAGYPRGDLPVAQFVFTEDLGTDRIGTFTTSIADATRPLNSYEVCWAAPDPFLTEAGAPAQIGATKPSTGEALYVGLLPDCARRGAAALPCVSDRDFDARTDVVTITVSASGQDPWKY